MNLGTTATDEINIGRQSSTSCDLQVFANSSTPTLRIVNKQAIFAHPITASADISSSGTIVANELQDTSLTVNGGVVHTTNGVLANTAGFTMLSEVLSVRSIANVATTNVTASGQISASGRIFGSGGTFPSNVEMIFYSQVMVNQIL